MRYLILAFLIAGCASSSPRIKADQLHSARVHQAVDRAESLLGEPLRSSVSVSFAPGDKRLKVKDIHGRSRIIWTKKVNDPDTGALLGYRGGLNYRGHILIYHNPKDQLDWEFDVLVHEVGHTINGSSEEADHKRMREAGFAF